jgi:hypothetical protein
MKNPGTATALQVVQGAPEQQAPPRQPEASDFGSRDAVVIFNSADDAFDVVCPVVAPDLTWWAAGAGSAWV